MQIRKRLIQARNGKSRTIVASELGITPQALGMIERGERVPRLPLMQRLSNYYGYSIDYFFGSNEYETYPDSSKEEIKRS